MSLLRDLQNSHQGPLSEFIRVYEKEQCLWRVKSKDYHDREKRAAAYGRLIGSLKKIDPLADRNRVVRKINNLRSNYRRDLKKMMMAKRMGLSKPRTLWYYPLFKFLEGQRVKDHSSSTALSTNSNETDEEAEFSAENSVDAVIPATYEADELEIRESKVFKLENPSFEALEANQQTASTDFDTQLCDSQQERHPPRESDGSGECDNDLEAAEERFKEPKLKEDAHDVFARNVLVKLRGLTDKRQRLLAERMINEALFYAEMGRLTLDHSITQKT